MFVGVSSSVRFLAYNKATQAYESCPVLGPYVASRGVAGMVCMAAFSSPCFMNYFLYYRESAKVRLAVNGSNSLGISGIIITDTWPMVFYLVYWQGFLK